MLILGHPMKLIYMTHPLLFSHSGLGGGVVWGEGWGVVRLKCISNECTSIEIIFNSSKNVTQSN